MRILLIHKNWRPHGGVEDYVFRVARLLERRGHRPLPFATRHPDTLPTPHLDLFPGDPDLRGGGAVSRAGAVARAVTGWGPARALSRLCEREQPDAAVVFHVYHQLGSTLLRVLARRRIPFILSLHDYKLGCPSYRLFSDADGSVCTRCLDRRGAWLWEPARTRCWDGSALGGAVLGVEALASRIIGGYRRAGVVMVVNDLQRRAAEVYGIPPGRIRVVPHPVEPVEEPADPVVREGHALFVGRLVPEKGVDVAIRASATSGVPLTVVGDGRLRPELTALAGDLRAPVTFAGPATRDEVFGHMRRAAMLVVPSLWHEIWGLVINEAISVGLPVIGSDVGGISDLLGAGRGVLVPPGDVGALAAAMSRLAADPGHRERLARAAADHAAVALSPARFEAAWEAMFEDIGRPLGPRRGG